MRLALTNASSSTITVQAHCDLLSDTITIPAYETTIRELPRRAVAWPKLDEISSVSCDLISTGPSSSLRAAGSITYDGYAAPIRFYDPSTATSSNLTAVSLATSSNTIAAVHNTTNSALTVNPVVREASLSNPMERNLPPLIILPHSTIALDVEPALQSLNAAGTKFANITVETAAPLGSLVGAVTQIDAENIVEDIPFRTSNSPAFDRGSYPLRWSDDYANRVTIANTSSQPRGYRAAITAGTAVYVLPKVILPPNSSMVYDVDSLRLAGTIDINGGGFPKDATFGNFLWSELSDGKTGGLLGRTSLSSRLNKRRSSFSCGEVCEYSHDSYPWFTLPIWTTIVAGSSITSGMTEHYDSINWPNTLYPYNFQSFYYNNSPVILQETNSIEISATSFSSTVLVESGLSPGSAMLSYVFLDFYQTYAPGASDCDTNLDSPTYSGQTNVVSISCGSATRGSTVTCTGLPSNATFSNWSFTDGTNTVTRSLGQNSNTWSGTAVKSGIVQVTVTNTDLSMSTVLGYMTVNNRDWHTNPTSANEVQNGALPGGLSLPVPPTISLDSGLGRYYEETPCTGFSSTTITGGPNDGFFYYASQPSISPSYKFVINPDLENTGSTFFSHQSGHWSSSNPGGTIAGATLLAQTLRHESSTILESHYLNWENALSMYNLGDYVEARIGSPGASRSTFDSDTASSLTDLGASIVAATVIEPYDVNYDNYGNFDGNVCYPNYTDPNTCN